MNDLYQKTQPFLPFLIKLVLFFVALFIFNKIAGPLPFTVKNYTSGSSDVFSMTGEGRVTIKPDVAVVNLGVEAEDKTVKEAQDKINQVMKAVTGEVKKIGIKEEDIKTENYNIYPTYDERRLILEKEKNRPIPPEPLTTGPVDNAVSIVSPPIIEPNKSKITGYRASTNISVKIKDTEKVNEVIDRASANGANQIGGVSFDVEDRSKAENEARIKAVEEARKKALEASKTAGIKLGKVVNYSEYFGPSYGFGGRAVEVDATSYPTDIQEGSTEVVVNATLTYEVK